MAAGGRSVACCTAVLLAAALLLSAPTATGSALRLLFLLLLCLSLSMLSCLCREFRELARSGARSPSRMMRRSSGSCGDASAVSGSVAR
jgi:hypothetical protein